MVAGNAHVGVAHVPVGHVGVAGARHVVDDRKLSWVGDRNVAVHRLHRGGRRNDVRGITMVTDWNVIGDGCRVGGGHGVLARRDGRLGAQDVGVHGGGGGRVRCLIPRT